MKHFALWPKDPCNRGINLKNSFAMDKNFQPGMFNGIFKPPLHLSRDKFNFKIKTIKNCKKKNYFARF